VPSDEKSKNFKDLFTVHPQCQTKRMNRPKAKRSETCAATDKLTMQNFVIIGTVTNLIIPKIEGLLK